MHWSKVENMDLTCAKMPLAPPVAQIESQGPPHSH